MSTIVKMIATVCVALVWTTFASAQDFSGVFDQYDATDQQIIDHQQFASFSQSYAQLKEDGIVYVDYANVAPQDHELLKTYIASLESVDPTALNREEAFAFWANLYNAVTLDVVLDAYPVKSIRDIRPSVIATGPWKKGRVTINGAMLSLDNIEHDILRAFWDEPRVHYAVNCASIGCPNLPLTPLTGEGLEEQLDIAARAYINHPRGVQVVRGKITASSIYNWFSVDFGMNDGEVIEHWRQYAEPQLRKELEGIQKINNYKYDWSLNDASQ